MFIYYNWYELTGTKQEVTNRKFGKSIEGQGQCDLQEDQRDISSLCEQGRGGVTPGTGQSHRVPAVPLVCDSVTTKFSSVSGLEPQVKGQIPGEHGVCGCVCVSLPLNSVIFSLKFENIIMPPHQCELPPHTHTHTQH